ncbi:unnamed protein product [Didymodactylos carnosus]|uniref:J domain-containing protein n=2 Tax=Didymodactylos carnosus TaxID=1234261 RepID=A0A815H970_9BILA|nr:unnamed protein product [Didymodactylos carnosus]CAF4217424.1 unnamed protein product [Didymodactylos carnosus]
MNSTVGLWYYFRYHRVVERWHQQSYCLNRTVAWEYRYIPCRYFLLTVCRFKTANLNSKNFYNLLGIEKMATQKQIKQAFFKLSKEYHPDSNPNDKRLHGKFVKINEAYNILSKQSSRTTYDQMLNNSQALAHQRQFGSSSSAYSNEDPFININRARKQY